MTKPFRVRSSLRLVVPALLLPVWLSATPARADEPRGDAHPAATRPDPAPGEGVPEPGFGPMDPRSMEVRDEVFEVGGDARVPGDLAREAAVL